MRAENDRFKIFSLISTSSIRWIKNLEGKKFRWRKIWNLPILTGSNGSKHWIPSSKFRIYNFYDFHKLEYGSCEKFDLKFDPFPCVQLPTHLWWICRSKFQGYKQGHLCNDFLTRWDHQKFDRNAHTKAFACCNICIH